MTDSTNIFSTTRDVNIITSWCEELKNCLNYNPPLVRYTKSQNLKSRNSDETDRGGWRGYYKVYSKYLSHLKEAKIKLLEIGFLNGFGVLAWTKYFANSEIYSIDKIFDYRYLKDLVNTSSFKEHNFFLFDTTVRHNWNIFSDNSLDVIIDDGDHHPRSQKRTFDNSISKLKIGGLYFIEDVSHRYGEDELLLLSDTLVNNKMVKIEGVYKHYNYGVQEIKESDVLSKMYSIINRHSSSYEYLIVLRRVL